MKAYSYDFQGIYNGEVEMQKNPRADGYLMPASSTKIPLPEDIKEYEVAKFNVETNSWECIPNEEYVREKLLEKDEYGVNIYEKTESGGVVAKNPELYEAERIAAFKKSEIDKMYLEMSKDVYDGMEQVFGTRNASSASATAATYEAMVKRPDNYIGVMPGLDSAEDVLLFANTKLAEADAYGIARLKRIAKFSLDKAAVLNENL